jgi:hypothetical protein
VFNINARRPSLRNRISEHIGFAIILVAFVALGALYSWATPLLETPDEPSHFSVVKYMADELRLPAAQPTPLDAGPVPVIQEGPPVYYAPPLYYALSAPLIAGLDTDGFAKGVIPNPNWARGWAPTLDSSLNNKHIYVLTADQRAPLAGWATAMTRLRVFSLLMGAATIVGVYALARTVWRRQTAPERGTVAALAKKTSSRNDFNRLTPQATQGLSSTKSVSKQSLVLTATALVAFNPAFLFVTSGVTNDALLFALSTWAFVLMVQLVLRGAGRQSTPANWVVVFLLGIVLGLAALTKQSTLAILPVAALAVFWGARGQPQPRRAAVFWLLLLVSLIVLLAGWWYLNNTLTYGDPLGFQPHQTPEVEWRPSPAQIVRQLGQALQGYWAVFGWGLIQVEPPIYIVIGLFALVGLSGLTSSFLSGRLRSGPSVERRIVAVLGLGVLLNLMGLLLWLWRTSAPYGRLLFPTLGPVAVLLVLGWQRWLGRRYRRVFAWIVVLVVGLFAFYVPWRYLRPAYADPVVTSSTMEDATRVDIHFDEKLHLMGYGMEPQNANPGERTTFTLYWQAADQVDVPLTVFVQLAPNDPEQQVTSIDDYLGGSHYPSDVWQPGETIRQVHRLQLPDELPAPGVYWFTIGLYNVSDKARLPVVADGAQVPDRVVKLGPLRVLNRSVQQPAEEVDYRLGSAVRLNGYDVELVSPPESLSESVMVTLHWEAMAALDQDLTVFIHLLDADGNLVAQHDGPPRQGDFSTWAWEEGDRIPDSHTLLLPADLERGMYRLVVGMYGRQDGARLPVFDEANQRVPGDAMILTELNLSGRIE